MKKSPAFDFEDNGLRSHFEVRDERNQPQVHSHNEIEILFLEKGSGKWMIGGNSVAVRPGHLTVFWAIRPHRVVSTSPNTAIHWLTVPLTLFSEWKLPPGIAQALMSGAVVEEADATASGQDRLRFHDWHYDLVARETYRRKLALMEIEARLGRLAFRSHSRLASPHKGGSFSHRHFQKAAGIARYVSTHFNQSLSIDSIASAVDMSPGAATRMFKKVCRTNLSQFLLQHRMHHAQKLLASTDHKILDVALASGYPTASRFYAAFRKFTGTTPDLYRRNHSGTAQA